MTRSSSSSSSSIQMQTTSTLLRCTFLVLGKRRRVIMLDLKFLEKKEFVGYYKDVESEERGSNEEEKQLDHILELQEITKHPESVRFFSYNLLN